MCATQLYLVEPSQFVLPGETERKYGLLALLQAVRLGAALLCNSPGPDCLFLAFPFLRTPCGQTGFVPSPLKLIKAGRD